MPGGSIDFDGTNDGYYADTTSLPANPTTGNIFNNFFLHGYFNYDAQIGTKTLAYCFDGGDSTKFVSLTKSGNTLTWLIQNGVGNTAQITAAISAATWTGFQCYGETSFAFGMGLRVWTTGTAPAFSTSPATTGTPDFPETTNNLYFGWNGASNFFNGREAHFYVAPFAPDGTTADLDAVADMLAAGYDPPSLLPPLYANLSHTGLYWPMQYADQPDVFYGAALENGTGSGSGTPTTHDSSPRIVIPGRMAG